ncbi:MAG: hypothetical protein IKO07_06720 [Clostridia bacterium]|nr:hypothetical protein [Clostridia bacterium]
MEVSFWLEARLALPYAQSLGEWLRLVTPGPYWEEVSAAGWAERAFYWSARLLALASTGVAAGLVFMNEPAWQRFSGYSIGRKSAAMASWCLAAALVGTVFVTADNGEKMEPWDVRNDISDVLEMDCRDAAVLSECDSHGGFHGDGTSFYALRFEDGALLEMIEKSRRWKPLPLSRNLTAAAYGLRGNSAAIGPYITDDRNRQPLFPPVANGFYFFLDRQATGEARFSDKAFLDRSSLNFTLALFDAEAMILYFAKIDT